MSTITDFFLAREAEIPEILGLGPAGRLPTVPASAVDPVKLARLLAIVDGQQMSDDLHLALDAMTPVASGGAEGPWVCRLPAALVDALAEAEEFGKWAAAWATTEEWSFDRGTPDALERLLRDLARLARSTDAQRALFMWMAV